MKINKILVMVSAILFSILLTSCKSKGNKNKTTTTNVEKETILETDNYLFRNGSSSYTVVIPNESTKNEMVAADEMVYFFKMSTGYNFSVKSEDDFDAENEKYISLGNTNLLKRSGIEVDDDVLKLSGYGIKTVGDNVYIYGSSLNGSLGAIYGTYAFLNFEVGYKAYASDEFAINKLLSVKLLDFDKTYIPSYELRSLGYYSLTLDQTYSNRLMLTTRGGAEWAYWGHTMTRIISKDRYFDEHPDWFSSDGTYLDLSNEEMTEQFIENCKEYLRNSPNATYIALTPPDETGFCYTENTKNAIQKYGTASGLTVVFLNKVAEKLDEWLETEFPGRKMIYMTLMYHATEEPPVKKDENGNYIPFCDEVIARDNVMVELVFPGLDFKDTLEDGINKAYKEKMLGWKACASNLSAYSYCINFWNYFIPFDNFSGVESLYRTICENGFTSLHENGPLESETTCFQELKIYVQSQLLWDASQRYEELASDFMNHYYKDASGAMKEYYDLIRAWYKVLETEKNVTSTIYFSLDKAEYWPKELLDQYNKIFDKAYEAIEYLKESDEKMYTTLFNRIKKEQLSVEFLQLSFYQSYYSKDTNLYLLNDFKKYTSLFYLTNYKEGVSIDEYLEKWEEKLK